VPLLRLDALVVQKGLASGRDQAKAYILAGQITVDGKRVDKAGVMVAETAEVTFTGHANPFVSRGGLKLIKALEAFRIDLAGKRVLDLGASTGGFTDCALQRGADHVVAVDVGYGQLAWSLRTDSRVTVLERTNARYLTLDLIGEPVDFISADLSFISLTKIIPVLPPLLKPAGELVLLVKPQFEAGRDQVGKKGVVKDPQVHIEVIEKVAACARQYGLTPVEPGFSPITGPEGNIEYLLHLIPAAEPSPNFSALVAQTVATAHQTLQPGRR
jgi:23S rRNA (cytidine1920-2'-O)/16S rRNA (cytidine1409-2'-O)-methyltransferase